MPANLPIFAAILCLFCTCGPAKNRVMQSSVSTYWVNSQRVPCTGVGEQRCLQVKKGGNLEMGEWQNFYASIEGFDYEPGYVYQLRVRETPRPEPVPADASSIVYTLEEVIEKRLDSKLRLNDIWALERVGITDIGNEDLPQGIERPTIEFQLVEKRVGGTNGCNNFSGELLEVGERKLKLGPLAMTRKACMGSNIPDRVTSALNKVSGYQLDGLKLSLLNEAGAEILRYRKVD